MMVPVALVGSRCNIISFRIKLCVELCMAGMASRCNVISFCIGLCVQLCMAGMTSRCNFISFRIELCVELCMAICQPSNFEGLATRLAPGARSHPVCWLHALAPSPRTPPAISGTRVKSLSRLEVLLPVRSRRIHQIEMQVRLAPDSEQNWTCRV